MAAQSPDFTCGLSVGGVAYCWKGAQPWVVSSTIQFASVGTGEFNACGVTTLGSASCWTNSDGYSYNLYPVSGGLTFASLSRGTEGAWACGVASGTGAAWCWGPNDVGQLGDGSTGPGGLTPVPVAGGLVFTSVSAGCNYACGVTQGGAAYCWGLNGAGDIGDGTRGEIDSVPVPVTGGLSFPVVSAGFTHTCGITTANAAYCWGAGALGSGAPDTSLVPVPVSGGLAFAQISVGSGQTCGITTAGVAYCWGVGPLLGSGANVNSTTPVRVAAQP